MSESDDIRSGRSGNFAMKEMHRQMDDDERPLVEVLHHMDIEDEYLIHIDHLQFGGALTGEELRALRDELTRFVGDES